MSLFMKSYDHKKIEKKWQKEWTKKKLYKTADAVKGKKNFHLLVEFPYPSGNLHIGHWYAFAVPDILARTMRMQGKNVLYPFGFDAFGLPAENAAIKRGLNPKKWTYQNIAYMKKQMASIGASFDWSREVITCDPAYYKWTQWQFNQFFKNGLAYQKETPANWCPKDKTVLANEQVVAGKCERCGTEVEQRQMLQWNLAITTYADRLIDDLAPLDWPEQIKESQKNWIGRSEGAEIDFKLTTGELVTAFTTRPDTLFGATYLVLAPEHLLLRQCFAGQALQNKEEVAAYVAAAGKKSDLERQTEQKEKTGVELKGVGAINPATGEEIPVWVADYVLGHYGTGAIMAVPAHDERDFDFAKKFDLPIRAVVVEKQPTHTGVFLESAQRPGIFLFQQRDDTPGISYPGMVAFFGGAIESGEGVRESLARELREELGYEMQRTISSIVTIRENNKSAWIPHIRNIDENSLVLNEGKAIVSMSLEEALRREDVVPHVKKSILEYKREARTIKTDHGVIVDSGEFDGLQSDDAKKAITEKFGRAKTTYKLRDWGVSRQRYWGVPIPIIHCPECGAVPVPDKDLPVKLPEIKDYLPTGDGKSPLAKAEKWVNVKCPQCKGKAKRETDTLDTFVDSSWYFLRYSDPKNAKRFADSKKMARWMPVDLYSGGAEHTTMHVLYSRFWQKALYDLKLVKDSEPYTRRMNRSLIMGPDGQKMSKSRGNVIDPDEIVKRLGADTVRMYLAFVGPYNEVASYPWNPDSVVGVRRFLERVWRVAELVGKKDSAALDALLHKTIKKVGDDNLALKFNTAISALMIFLNAIEKEKAIGAKQWATFLRLLAPFAPHMAEELWRATGNKKSIHLEKWPKFDAKKLIEDSVVIGIQINGKTRGEVRIESDASKEAMEQAARTAVAARLEGKEIQRVIVVPNRLVNFVVAED